MQIYSPQIKIDDSEGFDPEKDIFGHAEFGQGLMTLNERIEGPLVIALDGPWGSGKTTFIKMWLGLLRNNGFPVIYLDAFANDHTGDAFTAIAGEVVALADKLPDDKKKAFMEVAPKVLKTLTANFLKKVVKESSGGLVDIDGISDSIREVEDSVLLTQLKTHVKEREAFNDFRETLKGIAIELGKIAWEERPQEEGSSEQTEPPNRPLIFVIDELDRCKPPFALAVLESIKHFFSVEGVNFILVTNLEQLENSVKRSYGDDVDARIYLEKFYNLVVDLPNNERKGTTTQTAKFLFRVFKDFPDDGEHNSFSRRIIEQLSTIAIMKNLSLRTIEKIATRVALVLATTTKKDSRYVALIPCLCTLKIDKRDLYEQAKNKTLKLSEVTEYFRFEEWEKKCGFDYTSHLQDQWKTSLDPWETSLDPNGDRTDAMRNLRNENIIPRQCELIDQIRFSG